MCVLRPCPFLPAAGRAPLESLDQRDLKVSSAHNRERNKRLLLEQNQHSQTAAVKGCACWGPARCCCRQCRGGPGRSRARAQSAHSPASMAGTNPSCFLDAVLLCVRVCVLTHAVKHGKPRLRQARRDSQLHVQVLTHLRYICACVDTGVCACVCAPACCV